MTKKDLID